MKTSALPVPGIVFGAYPERRVRSNDWITRFDTRVQSLVADALGGRSARYREFVGHVRLHQAEIERLDLRTARDRLRELRALLAREGFQDELVAEAFAHIVRASKAALDLEPFGTQIIAARIMLEGRLAEMATGEGKTLAAALCAATAALAGVPVHVITVNDYLVERDACSLRPLYNALGLTVGAVTQQLGVSERRFAYACDITYCTAKELAFDYLRDGVELGHARESLRLRAQTLGVPGTRTLLRGLCMALVDEADSVLIDEARVPLILSETRTNAAQHEYLASALRLARELTAGRHYILDRERMTAELTGAGKQALEGSSGALGEIWRNRPHREETVCTALAALHLYRRDRQYLVEDEAVVIIDEATGRVAPGRIWSRGLHQLIELKEGCIASGERVTAAQITFQRFFQRYLRLGGMSGTLAEARGELRAVYHLSVTPVPLRNPSRRRVLPTTLYPNRGAQFEAVVARVQDMIRAARPVLVGTDSVEESEALSARLAEAGIEHEVLNARQDARESEIIARAGQSGAVTVATNMAGRGTDIPLGSGVAERGGLHLICCQHNAARRSDRQLLGRCARQGDPGTAETLLALDQPRIGRFLPAWLRRRVPATGITRPSWLVALAVLAPQWLEEAAQRTQRRALLEQDERLDRARSIGGPAE
ncbi:MAG TPA: hypothetical protein VED01_11730 [Burkholderiales bacterium]|nr:hypothetical protein [Burkholderiales bacterium]